MVGMLLEFALLLISLFAAPPGDASDYFAIRVVDEVTGRGVPLVELRAVDQTRYWTDSQGLVAFREPGLMNENVFFHVKSHGYKFPADGFGYHGKALLTTPGREAELRVRRANVAERLYRVTGAGTYRDSMRLGRGVPIRHPLLNAKVAGSDSVNTVIYHGQVHWFWGDTNRPAYPLGTFHVPGAVSRLPHDGGLDPLVGVDLAYFTRDDGFAAGTCEMPGEGPTWIDGLCVIRDPGRGERMFAKYVKVRKFLDVYQRGLVEFNDERKRFEKVLEYDFAAPLYPHGHAIEQTVDGADYVYFGNPYPLTRVRATADALRDPGRFEAFTPLEPGSSLEKPAIDRDSSGAVRYAWKTGTPAPTAREQAKWLESGLLKRREALLALCDVQSGREVNAHAGTVAWNAFRRRFVMIAQQEWGTSNLGEIWYAEADTPLGPWVYARKIVTHDKYSFYNPRHHPMFDQEQGRRIFFEGTYSTFFSGNDAATPLYDYNQIMYALDLADPRVVLPVPIYEQIVGETQWLAPAAHGKIVFMAPDRPREGLVAVGRASDATGQLVVGATGDVVFYALSSAEKKSPATTVALYEWRDKNSLRRWFAVEGRKAPDGYERAKEPLCRVWRCPIAADIAWK
ncbi:MAG: hypothetical protein WD063_21635 [Pirellulales bacterium]